MLKTAVLPTSWRSNWRKQSLFLISSCTMLFSNQLERGPNTLSDRRRELPHRDHFRDSNDVNFTKDIAKSLTDRCESRLTFKISNAMLSKHLARRKWRLFTFAKLISCRTMNLTFPNDSRVDFVLFCRWDRVSTTFLSQVIDDRSFSAVT